MTIISVMQLSNYDSENATFSRIRLQGMDIHNIIISVCACACIHGAGVCFMCTCLHAHMYAFTCISLKAIIYI